MTNVNIQIIPVFKNEDESAPNNYRPISLFNRRIFEKLMHKRLKSFIDKYVILSKFQCHGFSEHPVLHSMPSMILLMNGLPILENSLPPPPPITPEGVGLRSGLTSTYLKSNEPILDEPITLEEIRKESTKLKTGKAAANDSISHEMIKSSVSIIGPVLQILFNKVFNSGIFPQLCRWVLLHPYLKRVIGDIGHPNNYRGITCM